MAVSKTTARLEYDTTARNAPTVISSSRSLPRDSSSAFTAGAWVNIWVDALTSLKAISIRPRPIRMRPKRPTSVSGRERKSTTPMKMHSGDNQDRSTENTTVIRLVPMSAPNMTARASGSATKPCPTKEDTISEVAVLD